MKLNLSSASTCCFYFLHLRSSRLSLPAIRFSSPPVSPSRGSGLHHPQKWLPGASGWFLANVTTRLCDILPEGLVWQCTSGWTLTAETPFEKPPPLRFTFDFPRRLSGADLSETSSCGAVPSGLEGNTLKVTQSTLAHAASKGRGQKSEDSLGCFVWKLSTTGNWKKDVQHSAVLTLAAPTRGGGAIPSSE